MCVAVSWLMVMWPCAGCGCGYQKLYVPLLFFLLILLPLCSLLLLPPQMVDASGAMANPMYQSAQSGQSREDIYASAGSMGGDYGAAAPTAAGPAGGSSSGQPFSNPLAGGDGGGEEEEEAGQNPLFAQQQAPAVRPPSATSLSFKPAGLKK
jgi:hypothetical protein